MKELAAALAKAQAAMKNAAYNKENPHYRNRYADLAAIRDATIPHLAANGLAIVQYPKIWRPSAPEGEGYKELVLCTLLLHSSGQSIEGEYPIGTGTPQQIGSALTYAKRYSWASMCGIAAEEDDDANAAETAPKAPPKGRGKKAEPLDDPAYTGLRRGITNANTIAELEKWHADNAKMVEALPDESRGMLRDEYGLKLMTLKESTDG